VSTIAFGSARAAAGELATGVLPLGEWLEGPVTSPVMLARGAKPGPCLFVQCLIHGGENVGPIALARFLRGLDLTALSGTIKGLMIANPLGHRQHSRLTPQDGANLNRVFPGKPDGTVSEQLAHRLLDLAASEGDAVVDLHSGGELTITAFYAIYPKGPGAAERESERLAVATGSPYPWGATEAWLDGAAFTNICRRRGVPAIIVESGGGARVTDTDLARFQQALTGVCRAMGMLAGAVEPCPTPKHGGNAVHVKCIRGGYWEPHVQPGDTMTAGQLMGVMRDITGLVVEEVRCPARHAWVGSIRRPWMPLYNGEQVVEVVEWTNP
jgi:uncharacterized protein